MSLFVGGRLPPGNVAPKMITNSPLTPNNVRLLRAALDDFTVTPSSHSRKKASKRILEDLLFRHAKALVTAAESGATSSKPKSASTSKK